jgi:large subunit ribosomal protein L24
LEVLVKKNRAIVEGINMVSKATKPSAQNNEGGFVKKEASIHISNLMLICPETGKPTRIGRKIETINGVARLVRYSKKSKDKKEIK